MRLAPLALALVACTSGAQRSSGNPDAGHDVAGTTNAGASGSDAFSTGTAGTGPGGNGGNGGTPLASGAGGTSSDAGPADATGSGGAPDAANDAPVDSGTSGCAGLLCEDFESGKIDPGKWDIQMSGGTMSVQQQIVAHGKYAMQVHGAAGPSDWALLVAKNVPPELKGKTTFGRVYFYITPKPLTSGHTQMVYAGNTGTGTANGPAPFPKLRYMEVANIGGGWQLGFDLLDVGPLVEEVAYPKGQVPTMAWVCLEWEFEDSPDHITMWADGTQIGIFDDTDVAYSSTGSIPQPGGPLYNGKSSDIIGGFDTFGFGFHDWHPQKPFDLYYDDLVLGTT
ncbi:MAG TPA: hypothetical protein VGY54_15695, partial [Polyangiaceae bacterium]|nr:hypothetical protein [Polyangiaceae bacterium]